MWLVEHQVSVIDLSVPRCSASPLADWQVGGVAGRALGLSLHFALITSHALSVRDAWWSAADAEIKVTLGGAGESRVYCLTPLTGPDQVRRRGVGGVPNLSSGPGAPQTAGWVQGSCPGLGGGALPRKISI